MLLHAAQLQLAEAEKTAKGRFNHCLSAMVMTALAVEALANAVGSRVVSDWQNFEQARPFEKLDTLVALLSIPRDPDQEPWTTLRYLSGFRNDIAHAKPEKLEEERVLPELALEKDLFRAPKSKLEREITLGNARRVLKGVQALKGLLTDALPLEKRLGIYVDTWSGSSTLAE
jgi:hypothetical protein